MVEEGKGGKKPPLYHFWDAISEAFTPVCIKKERHVFGRVGA